MPYAAWVIVSEPVSMGGIASVAMPYAACAIVSWVPESKGIPYAACCIESATAPSAGVLVESLDDEHAAAPAVIDAAPKTNSAARDKPRDVGGCGAGRARNSADVACPQNGHAPSLARM
jgi:hypothetical protein